ncbi:7TM domain-containing protein [Bythopirellula goksoeyrii]|uniref:Transglutaminase-like superfamily protein n=1 Tax=Bythopirellula goksoeyrii TaxID=1400387 RepID=A0A5B9Q8S7_9BACT|nr:7TM domain-containing protein [Bythopirellula goksoeyrii]QEG33316.1 Transglutaminase-like superfamily protein [Bythopirellula goksoeyrii]
MSARVLSQIWAAIFILLGIVAFSLRYQARHEVQEGLQDSLWRLSYDIKFEVDSPEAEVRVGLPDQDSSAAIIEVEEKSHINLDAEDYTSPLNKNRELILTTQLTGNYQVGAEFEIRLKPRNAWDEQHQVSGLSSTARSRFLRSDATIDTAGANVREVMQQIPRGELTDSELVQQLFDFCSQSFKPGSSADGFDAVGYALANHQATPLGRVRTLVTLCRAYRIPARLVTGFELRQSDSAKPHVWAEVFYGHHWVPFDPTYGHARQMPYNFLPIRHDGEEIVRGEGIKDLSAKYTILRLPPPANVLQAEVRRPSQVLDLTRLPVEMHEIMSLMLLLPLGALITAIFRNLIGMRTLGTFAPALLAMSFIYAELATSLVILIAVLTAGYFGRIMLDRLHLLMVPRSSIVLTMIIMLIVFGVSLIDYADPISGVRAVLLPLVILTTLIERYFVTTEEDGMAFAMQLVVGTAVVAACCYLILGWKQIGALLLIYPELHFFTIAAFIWIGRYSGYRLVELWRFRDMVK